MAEPVDKNKDVYILEIAATTIKVLAMEDARVKLLGDKSIDIKALKRPGTIVWTDPLTGETRYTPPGDKMYSTAIMYQDAYIDKDGAEVKLFGDE